jgi:hypothetical protein
LEPPDPRGGAGFSSHRPAAAPAPVPAAAAAPVPGPPTAPSRPAADLPAGERPQSLAALVRLWQDDTSPADLELPAPVGAPSQVPRVETATPPRSSPPPAPAGAAPPPSTLLPELAAQPSTDGAWAPVLGAPAGAASRPLAASPPPRAARPAAFVPRSDDPAVSVSQSPPVAGAPAAADVEEAVERLLLAELRRHGIQVDAG